MRKDGETGRIQVLERVARILELFTVEHTEWRFSDIVIETGLSKSTVFNIVNTLHELNFLEQDEETRKYRLGRQMLRLSEVAKRSIQISKIALPYMTQLKDAVNETVQLAKLDKNNTIYLAKAESIHSVQTHSMMGTANPAHATGLGKAMLAYKSDSYIDDYFNEPFEQLTENTLKNKDELKKELESIRKAGMSFDREEFSIGLICYACPIFNHKGQVVYAISVSMPTYRLTSEKEDIIKKELKEKARMISRQLGYQGLL